MIRLHAHPLPPPSSSCLSLSRCLCVSPLAQWPLELTDERGWWRGWADCKITRVQESLALYKSFNTLCSKFSLMTAHPAVLFPQGLTFIRSVRPVVCEQSGQARIRSNRKGSTRWKKSSGNQQKRKQQRTFPAPRRRP
jgi:hypothetical protein